MSYLTSIDLKPVRIQRRRVKGWRMPANTVYVGRATKWGNPWRVAECCEFYFGHHRPLTAMEIVSQYRAYIKAMPTLDPGELRGRNLACWCPLDRPCHADVLLELANRHSDPLPPQTSACKYFQRAARK